MEGEKKKTAENKVSGMPQGVIRVCLNIIQKKKKGKKTPEWKDKTWSELYTERQLIISDQGEWQVDYIKWKWSC